ncbi:MAG TPA: hypothetical protein VLX85_00890 [Stellaceae bacterium]|nr:hypothetical protein [Stellaceae bacterium]
MLFKDRCPVGDIRTLYGPHALLRRYFAFAEAEGRKRGVWLRVRTDFDRLLEVSRCHADSFPKVSPIFDPALSVLSTKSAFWIEAIDESGETAATSAVRICDHAERSLADDFRSLRIFFARPEKHLRNGERIEVIAPAAEHIRGRVAASGVVWVRPDYRRHGLTKIIPRLARSCALTSWNTPVFWGLVKPEHDEVGLTQAYGSWQIGGKLVFHMPSWLGDVSPLFLWMDRDTLIADIETADDHAMIESSRRIETAITKKSPRLRQGISTRS